MMALHLVAPQHSDEDSASNQCDSPEPCSDDDSSILTQPSTSNPPSSAIQVIDGQDLGRDDDSAWLKSQDMAILKVISSEPCLANCQDQHHHCIKRLPAGTKPVKLVGEGSANAVFEIKVPQRDRAGRDMKGLLLRVAKVPSLGAPLSYNYLLQQKYLQTAVKPILGDHIVHQELVVLHKSNIVRELNNLLRDINHTRRDKFKGTYVGETDWGFLIEDMRPQDIDSCVLVEFKPKWLSQSPSAPKGAIRCRQCAMELRNLTKDPSRNKTRPERKPCPLALMNSDCPWHICSPFRMAPHLADEPDSESYVEALRRIASHDAIRDLKEQQDIHDKVGPLRALPSDPFFPLAMTLRDCTCFAQIDKCSQSVRIRFGDLDWKDPGVKFETWRGVEAELVEGGFYTSEWILCGNQFYRPPTLCLLEHGPVATKKKPEIIQITDLKHHTDGGGQVDTHLFHIPKDTAIHSYSTDANVLKQILAPFRSDAPTFVIQKDLSAQ